MSDLEPDEVAAAPRGRRWPWIVGGAAVLAALIGVFLLLRDQIAHVRLMLETKIVGPEMLSERAKEFLAAEILEEGEEVVWFYTLALTDLRGDGNVLTDRRLISWYHDEETDEMVLDWNWLVDLAAVRVHYGKSSLEDTELVVWGHPYEEDGEVFGGTSGDGMLLYLSVERGRDHVFCVDAIARARELGAQILAIDVGGAVSDDELRDVDGARRWGGDDVFEPPPELVAAIPAMDTGEGD